MIPQSEPRQSLSATRTSLNDLRARKVRTVQIYTTNRCNSRCVHCYVWQYKNNMDLPVETIARLLEAKCLAPVNDLCLEGGEFTLHPAYKEILSLFKGRQVCVITIHGILTDRTVNMVETSKISKLIISLDGTRETYARLRARSHRAPNTLPTNLILMKGVDVLGPPAANAVHREPQLRERRLAQILEWAGSGRLRPVVSQVYPLADLTAALRAKWHSTWPGNIVVRP